jgi:HEPN domain-containing protein
LDELITGLEREGITVPVEVKDALILTSYAWEVRYPGLSEPVTEEYKEAVALAENIVKWVRNEIGL